MNLGSFLQLGQYYLVITFGKEKEFGVKLLYGISSLSQAIVVPSGPIYRLISISCVSAIQLAASWLHSNQYHLCWWWQLALCNQFLIISGSKHLLKTDLFCNTFITCVFVNTFNVHACLLIITLFSNPLKKWTHKNLHILHHTQKVEIWPSSGEHEHNQGSVLHQPF